MPIKDMDAFSAAETDHQVSMVMSGHAFLNWHEEIWKTTKGEGFMPWKTGVFGGEEKLQINNSPAALRDWAWKKHTEKTVSNV